MINRLLNHAARIRVRTLTGLGPAGPPFDDGVGYETELEITGTRRLYLGDGHVWRWYRGTGVGPYPCCSALQALERMCDQVIEAAYRLRDSSLYSSTVAKTSRWSASSLESSYGILRTRAVSWIPYLEEPFVWRHEFRRTMDEMSGLAAGSEGLVKPDRRKWSLREAAAHMVLLADEERGAELRAVGEKLVANARPRHRVVTSRRCKRPGGECGCFPLKSSWRWLAFGQAA